MEIEARRGETTYVLVAHSFTKGEIVGLAELDDREWFCGRLDCFESKGYGGLGTRGI